MNTQHTIIQGWIKRSSKLGQVGREVCLTAALLGLPAVTGTVQAQTTPVQINLPAQSLSEALIQLGEQASLQIFYLPETVRGLQAPAVSGVLTPDQALQRLLAGTGIGFSRDGSQVSLSRTPQSPTQLGAVVVKGRTDSTTEDSGAYTATGDSALSSALDLSLRETPQSISVMTNQRMKDQNLMQLEDVAKNTAGLTLSESGMGGSDRTIYARGFAVNTIMVDGVRMVSNYNNMFLTQDMSLYDRVEVVRGATGLMNGMGNPGGAINMVRKRPLDEFRTEVQLDWGSWANRRGMFDISSPLNESGSVRGRMIAVAQDTNAYVERFNAKRKVFYGVLEADVGENTLIRGGISHQRHDLRGQSDSGLPVFDSNGNPLSWGRSQSAAAEWAYSERRSTTLFGELEHQLSDKWSLRVNASRVWTDSDEFLGYAGRGNPDPVTGAGSGIWTTRWAYKPKQDSLDVAVKGSFDMFGRENEVAMGVAWSYSTNETPSYTNWYPPGWDGSIDNIFTWDGSSPGKPYNPAIGTHSMSEKNLGAYASIRLRPTEAFSIIAGTRYVDWRRTTGSFNYAKQTGTSLRRTEYELVPYFGLTYDLSENWTAYTSYTTIFTPQDYKKVDGSYIDPLSGESYEVGLKGSFFDERLNVSGAVYQVKEDNKAVALVDQYAPDGSPAYEGKSGTRTRGFEVEVAGMVTPSWELAASFAQNSTKDRAGERLNTNLPRNTFKLFTTYRVDGVGDGLTLGGGLRWQSRIYSDLTVSGKKVESEQKSYAVVDLMARYDVTKSTTVGLNINNVLDKRYRTRTGNSYYGQPRAFMLSLSHRF
ncbi:TonB-dependent siderophore receptor [Paenalcaligenes sp. Me52]|uniref:TonB-dependent siderophore receptor n=1 Tax=Paenalcaligenes sp. Me52 TaxID=3392038 RepID=UPI003D2B3230